MSLPSTPRNLSLDELFSSPGDMTLLGLAIAAREETLDGLRRGVPELTATGYDAAHVALIEAVAAIHAQVAYRAERLPLAVLVQAFELLGLERRASSAAVVDVYVDNPTAQDVFWTEGALVGAGRTVFEVAGTVQVPAGAVAYGPVALTCLERGPVGNVQARFPSWNFVTTVGLENILNPQPGQGGAWAESDAEYVVRSAQRFGARGAANRVVDFLTVAEETPGVQRALVVPHARVSAGARWSQFPWAGGSWGGPIYEEREGCVSVVVRPFGGGYLSSQLQSRLSAVIAAREPAGARVVVTSCEEVPVDVSLSVVTEAAYDPEAVRVAVGAALRAWLSPSAWAWGGGVTRAEVAAQAAKVAGVRSVVVNNLVPLSEKEDVLTLTKDAVGAVDRIQPLYPHVLLAARNVVVAASRV